MVTSSPPPQPAVSVEIAARQPDLPLLSSRQSTRTNTRIFRPRVLALRNRCAESGPCRSFLKRDDRIRMSHLPSPSCTLHSTDSPSSSLLRSLSSSFRWQRHAHGSYRAYYGARRRPVAASTFSTSSDTRAGNKDARLELLSPEWFVHKDCLDVGTNTGKVAWEIYESYGPRCMVGVDIDEELIRVAREKLAWAKARDGKEHDKYISFLCQDFAQDTLEEEETKDRRMEGSESEHGITNGGTERVPRRIWEGREKRKKAGGETAYLSDGMKQSDEIHRDKGVELSGMKWTVQKDGLAVEKIEGLERGEDRGKASRNFDVITCLSVTKHVHLQGGDSALLRLFRRMYEALRPGGRLILEPQAWRTYRKRKNASKESRENFSLLRLRPPFTQDLLETIGFQSVEELGIPPRAPEGFKRAMFCFVKKDALSHDEMPIDYKDMYIKKNSKV